MIPQTTIEDVFSSVQSGSATRGVVPFENSSNGSVVFTLDLFADTHGRYPDILVSGEIYLAVHHCLLGRAAAPHENGDVHLPGPDVARRQLRDTSDSPNISGQATPTQSAPEPQKPRVKPLHDLKHVKKLYSHPQAWGQCKVFLSTYLKGTERLDVSSTSRAAELVAQDSTGASAAISSRIAGELNQLDLLAENIEDREGNSTRFFVIQRRRDVEVGDRTTENGPGAAESEGEEKARCKSLVSFTVNHGEPGALADCLAVFKTYVVTL